MTPDQVKLALRLYKAYRTDTREYRELADALGINTGELNRRCWHIVRGEAY
jgi:hypothetical protein